MPYIKQDARNRLNHGGEPGVPGELAYLLYLACMRYLADPNTGKINYAKLAMVVGVLEGTKLEFVRRNLE